MGGDSIPIQIMESVIRRVIGYHRLRNRFKIQPGGKYNQIKAKLIGESYCKKTRPRGGQRMASEII